MDTSKSTFIISHSSALELLRQPGFRWYLEQGRRNVPACPRWDVSVARVHEARRDNGCVAELEEPIHVMTCDSHRGKSSVHRVVHCHGGVLPPDCLINAGFGVFCVSPELCLAQLAYEMGAAELFCTVMELCGTYRVGTGKTLYNQEPLTDVATLHSFAQSWRAAAGRDMRGIQKLLQIVRYAADGSASPRESIVHALLCLPTNQGGYGLPLPKLNYTVETAGTRLETSRRSSYRFDLCWPEYKLALEYDSDEFHSNVAQRNLDSEKRTAAQRLGHTVLSLTNGQLHNLEAMDELACLLSEKMGRRFRVRA